jgi:hypothetical protein
MGHPVRRRKKLIDTALCAWRPPGEVSSVIIGRFLLNGFEKIDRRRRLLNYPMKEFIGSNESGITMGRSRKLKKVLRKNDGDFGWSAIDLFFKRMERDKNKKKMEI